MLQIRRRSLSSWDVSALYECYVVGGGLKKNVIASCGAEGCGLGFNARAGLMTRGLAEITRLAVKLGANPLTMSGLRDGRLGFLVPHLYPEISVLEKVWDKGKS